MKKRLIRLITGICLLITALFVNTQIPWLYFTVLVASYLICGYDVLFHAIQNILRGKLFDENFLMSFATIGAFFIGEYTEAVAVMLFFQTGELFQTYAVNKSRKSIASLMELRPDYANIQTSEGLIQVDPYDVNVGMEIIVKTGERIPLDGIIVKGNAQLDPSALTGESLPMEVSEGEEVLSGCLNLNGLLTIRVTKEFGESTVNKILELVEDAGNKKSSSENFITKFSLVYTPIVVGLAVLLAVIPPFIFNLGPFSFWLERALSFLVVSCPCALVISVPLSFFGGIGGASRAGILVKGSNYLEALAKADTIVWDKTGTLTCGSFQVKSVSPISMDAEKLLFYTAHAELHSPHPIGLSLRNAYPHELNADLVKEWHELSGFGISATVDGHPVLIGNEQYLLNENIEFEPNCGIGTAVYVCIDEIYAGSILIADTLKEDSCKAISDLKSIGVQRNIMLTGDRDLVGQSVAAQLDIQEVYTQLLPWQKVEKLEEIISKRTSKRPLLYVGDGINDAPVLARADVGVSMGGLGSDVAIEASDIVLMKDTPSSLVTAIRIARKTHHIALQNIYFALFIKIAILILITFGFANMWAAVFADVGVCVLAILNSMRALSVPSQHNLKN